jgi:hypothetical protein
MFTRNHTVDHGEAIPAHVLKQAARTFRPVVDDGRLSQRKPFEIDHVDVRAHAHFQRPTIGDADGTRGAAKANRPFANVRQWLGGWLRLELSKTMPRSALRTAARMKGAART